MIFDSPSDVKWKPFYIQIIRMKWMGNTNTEIASLLSISDALVGKVVNSDKGREIFEQLQSSVFDSMVEVVTLAQAVAPEMLREKVKLALYSSDERIRSKNASDVLGIAGHVSIQKIVVDRPDPLLDKYKDKSELDLRRELLTIKGTVSPSDNGDVGPDGNLVN